MTNPKLAGLTPLAYSDYILDTPSGDTLVSVRPIRWVGYGKSISYEAGEEFRVKFTYNDGFYCFDSQARSVDFSRADATAFRRAKEDQPLFLDTLSGVDPVMDIEAAIRLALDAHAGQKDKGGAPYILHPLRVMQAVAEHGETFMVVAVLHDVPEDSGEIRLFRDCAMTPERRRALSALTRSDGEAYADYIARCAADPIARIVKAADLRDNMDLSRIPEPSAEDRARVRKYAKALKRLEGTG